MDKDEQIDLLRDKAISDRFSAMEARLSAIEDERKRVVSWAVKAFLLIGAYILKEPLARLWGIVK